MESTTPLDFQQFLNQMTRVLKAAVPSDRGSDSSAQLPIFEPEFDDVQNWISVVESFAEDAGWNEATTLVRVGLSLRGSAKTWFEEWRPSVNERTWSNLKLELVENFKGTSNMGILLSDAVNFCSQNCSSYSDYARIKLQKLKRTKLKFSSSDLVSIICHGISNRVIQMQMSQLNFATPNDLIHSLQFCPKPHNSRQNENPRPAASATSHRTGNDAIHVLSGPRCFNWNEVGHKRIDCPRFASTSSVKRERMSSPPPVVPSDKRSRLFCTFCKTAGHTEERCFKKRDSTRRVNLCSSPGEISG